MFREDLDDSYPLHEPPPTLQGPPLGAVDIGWSGLGPAIACTAVATAVVALRWYTRRCIQRCLGADDVIILVSMVLAWVMAALVGAEVYFGIGVYRGGRAIDAEALAKLAVASNAVWTGAVNSTKASVVAQYLRIFGRRQQQGAHGGRTRQACVALLGALALAVAGGVLGGVLLCSPPSKLWHPGGHGHCRSAQRYWTTVAALDLALDLAVLALPLPAIARLHLPSRRQKAVTLLVFLLGFGVCVVSAVRLAAVVAAADRGDYVQAGIRAIVWSAVEANVGIVCASLIALRPLLTKLCPRLFDEPGPPNPCLRLPLWHDGDESALVSHPSSPTLLMKRWSVHLGLAKKPPSALVAAPTSPTMLRPHLPSLPPRESGSAEMSQIRATHAQSL